MIWIYPDIYIHVYILYIIHIYIYIYVAGTREEYDEETPEFI